MYYGSLTLLSPIFISQSAFLFPNYNCSTQSSIHLGLRGARRWMPILSLHMQQVIVSDVQMSCQPNHCQHGS